MLTNFKNSNTNILLFNTLILNSFIELINNFTSQDWIRIISGLISLIPLIFTIKFYQAIRIKEYKIMTAFWFLQTIGPLSTPFIRQLNGSLPWKIRTSITLWLLYFIFLHAIQLLIENQTYKIKIIQKSVLFYTFLLELIIILWEPLTFNGSTTELFLFTKGNPNADANGAGLILFGTVIYSTSQMILQDILALITMSTIMYAYFTIKPWHETKRLLTGFKLWKTAVSMLFIYTIYSSLFWRFFSLTINFLNLLAISSLLIIAIISIFYPEAYLISKTQIMSVFKLYKNVENLENDDVSDKEISITEVRNYLDTIPKMLLNQENTS